MKGGLHSHFGFCILLCTVLSWYRPVLGSWQPDRLGIGGGFGGTGIQKSITVDGTATTVSRSEGPGVIITLLEWNWRSTMNLALEHSRGARLGPFSAGLGFTDFHLKWYPLGPGLTIKNERPQRSYLAYQGVHYFVGVGGGIAEGLISRESDQVPSVGGASTTISFRGGADYTLNSSSALRTELSFATSLMSGGLSPATFSKFAMGAIYVFAY